MFRVKSGETTVKRCFVPFKLGLKESIVVLLETNSFVLESLRDLGVYNRADKDLAFLTHCQLG